MNQIKSVQIEGYNITYTSSHIQIGCKRYTIEEWKNFSDSEIKNMDGDKAFKFWSKWKDWIFKTIEMSPATPTKTDSDNE